MMNRRLAAESPALFAFRGPDAVRYLNGQLTQDVRDLADQARASCVTDAKGRLQFMVSVFQGTTADEILVAGPAERGEELIGRLERYLIADEVEIEDRSGSWTRVHSEAPLEGAELVRRADGPFGTGFDHWYAGAPEPDGDALPDEEVEKLRIASGIPAWGPELEEGMLPPEAGLDRSAVSYEKGCYIGQEVLSRLKSVGRVNRRLARFETNASRPGMLLDDDGAVGLLTSLSPGFDQGEERPALGYIRKRGYERTSFQMEDGSTARFLAWA